jgi:hypothetical protein
MTILKERAVGSIRCGTNALGKGKGGGGVVLLLFTLDQPIIRATCNSRQVFARLTNQIATATSRKGLNKVETNPRFDKPN